MCLIGQGFIVQQDNDQKISPSYARTTLGRKNNGNLEMMGFLALSPDSIGLVWDELDIVISAQGGYIDELEFRIHTFFILLCFSFHSAMRH